MIRETRGDRRHSAREQLELLALRLEMRGPDAITLPVARRLAGTEVWLELRILLREHGFTEAEIAYLMKRHPAGCPCWECVMALHRAVQHHHEKLKKKAAAAPKGKRRRLG